MNLAFEERVAVPEHVEVTVTDGNITAKGSKGVREQLFRYPNIEITKEDGALVVRTKNTTRKYKRMFYTIVAHIKNMLRGVHEPYVYKLKICSGHFPMTVKVDGNKMLIGNFLGEKIPRKATILDTVKVTIDGDVILVESVDLNKAGQTAANIETATKIRKRDRRVFQDGIYLTEKPE